LPNSWYWEVKLDGYRALAVKSDAGVTLFSRRRKSLNRQFPYIVEALASLPEGTVVDGELIAIDDRGRVPQPSLLSAADFDFSRAVRTVNQPLIIMLD
jgi:bifunctional non-homologous end joining protein LigD